MTCLEILREDDVDSFAKLLETMDINCSMDIESDTVDRMISHRPPLISLCAFYGAVKCFTLLVSQGANLSVYDSFRTPLSHFAAYGGNLEICEICRQQVGLAGCVFPAIENHQLGVVRWLFRHGCKVANETDPRGYNPIIVAIEHNDKPILAYLLKRCQKLYKGDKRLRLLCFALSIDALEAAEVLLRFVDVNDKDACGNTPLHICCLKGLVDLTEKLLILPGTQRNIKNSDGKTALDLATSDEIRDLFAKNVEVKSQEAQTSAGSQKEEKETGNKSKTCILI